jgi:hypothetical protein
MAVEKELEKVTRKKNKLTCVESADEDDWEDAAN